MAKPRAAYTHFQGVRHVTSEDLYNEREALKIENAKLRSEKMEQASEIMNLRLRIEQQCDELWQKDQAMAEICGRNHDLNQECEALKIISVELMKPQDTEERCECQQCQLDRKRASAALRVSQ
jgi:hypothetical protein